jgi:uncharacterized protein (TIGR02466 family)
MNTHNLFPTVIATETSTELAKLMLPVARKYLDNKELVTNTWGYKNTYNVDLGLEQFDDLKPFINAIVKLGNEFLEGLGYDSTKINLHPHIFVSEMFENDYHTRHAHAGSLLSGILYLQVPTGSSPIVFTDPRPHRDFLCLPKKGKSSDQIFITPVEGLMLIWESWLNHEVPKNASKDGRITMVFNLGWSQV